MTTREAAAGGAFGRLGNYVVRWPLVVIGFWVALAAGLSLTLPSVTQMARERTVAVLPPDAPTLVTAQQMTAAFHESGVESLLLVVLADEKGLSPADENVYRTLVNKLRQDSRDVVMLQDFVNTPPLREAMTSKDHKAWYLPIGIAGLLNSPQFRDAYPRVVDIVKHTVAGSTLSAYLTGPAATATDLIVVGERDLHLIENATAVMVLIILLIIYRNPITMLAPLITIGISLVTAQAIVAGAAQMGLGISNEAIILMSAIMAGAGIDYAVFLISRYHDYVRLGVDSNQAVRKALASIGKVIAASAATVAVTFLGMIFSRLTAFQTIGPALAISIAVAFLAAVTFLPALLVLAGPRGWVKPRRDLTTRFWRRSGIRIVRRPAVHLVASLLVLAALAGCVSLARFNYDDRATLPRSVESTVGYAAMERHFPVNSTIPQYLLIRSPHDLRTPQALADLEQMAARISQIPDIASVRGITRPTGEPLQQASLTYQAGEVGSKLNDASGMITGHTGDLNQLANGANALADNIANLRSGISQAIPSIRGVVNALTNVQNQFGSGATLKQLDDAANLISKMHALGFALAMDVSNVANTFDWVPPVLRALDASPICDADPSCSTSRSQFHWLINARDNGTLNQMADLAKQLQSTPDPQNLQSALDGLRDALDTTTKTLNAAGVNQSGDVEPRLTTLQQSADTLADATRRLSGGVQALVEQMKHMGVGLADASAFLRAMKYDAATPSMAGFYIPPQVLTRDEFKKAAQVFVSPDGHVVRYLIQTKLNPFSTAALDQINAITRTAREAQPNTALADASISVGGLSAGLRDTREYYNHDFRLIVVVTIIVVFLILITLLRAIVAPLYLIASVVISYLSALGIGVIMFQFVLGQQLHWSVPGLTFIILVAVGADYNMLLISRIRDESAHSVRSGVIRTVGSTGGVITAAGVIFAATMFGLLFAGISTMVQAGFVMGVGLLLDTFLVRTITIPAIASLVGRANWWPSRTVSQPKRRSKPATRTTAPQAEPLSEHDTTQPQLV
ncbi:MMPL/RND family transporter [Mycobacterium botniense]|uniref:Putative transport protein MmpL8 n=1 Tax=Mycobacterium botniense TaxID=84962 RepID=A0A7I9Y1T4_9MYCO|nr:RND family transporter [Mycobacterium botniense]GFG76036.1 putative transport protein MmpL8 [Mycobacterium botniense]